MNGMSLIVKTITRLTVGVIFVFAVYIACNGHLTLGGGVVGGIVLALDYIVYVLAYGANETEERIKKEWAIVLMELGLLCFSILGILGMFWGNFLGNFLPRGSLGQIASAGLIPYFNLVIMILVGASIFVVFLTLVTARVCEEEEE